MGRSDMGRKGSKSFFISLAMRLIYLDINCLFDYYFERIVIILRIFVWKNEFLIKIFWLA